MFLGGGGGYEIDNKIEVYKVEDFNKNLLKNKVHEEQCGKACPNYFEVPFNVKYL